MRLPLRAVLEGFIESRWIAKGRPPRPALQRALQSQLSWNSFGVGATTMVFLLSIGGGFGAQAAIAQSTNNNVVTVDGVTYRYTTAGVQAAINNVSSVSATTGIGGAVMLPAATIILSSGLTMRSHVCLIGLSSDASWLAYSGSGSAVTFPPGVSDACLKYLTVGLASAGANAIGINVQGDYSAGLTTIYAKIQDVSVAGGAVKRGQIGMNVADLSPSGPAPAGVQLSLFDTIKLVNLGQPIVVNGQEGNVWKGIHVNQFSSIAVNDELSIATFWQLRISGSSMSASAIGFQEAANMNQIEMVCDFGLGADRCINDLGSENTWEVGTLTPTGTVASTSFLKVAGSRANNLPSNFQVSSVAVTGASPTIRSAAPTCLEMGNSDGSSGTNYVTFLNGSISATTTKPAACR
jgi:hypothetical protein